MICRAAACKWRAPLSDPRGLDSADRESTGDDAVLLEHQSSDEDPNRSVVTPRAHRGCLRDRLPAGGRPVGKLVFVADALQVGHPSREVRLRVSDRLVIDDRTDLLQAVVEQQAGLQIADLLIQVLGNVALDRRLATPTLSSGAT